MDSRPDPSRLLPVGSAILLLLLGGAVWLLWRDGRPPAAGRGKAAAGAPSRPAPGPALPGAGRPGFPADPPARPFGAIPASLQPEMGGQGPHHMLRGRCSLPYLCLTFDGAAHAGELPQILRILAERRISATFFLTGEFIAGHTVEARAIVQAGHEVGNHLFQHVHLTTWDRNGRQDLLPGVTRELLHRLLQDNEALFRRVTGREMQKVWRAPFGETNQALDAWAAESGYIHVAWTRDFSGVPSMDSLDWVADPGAARYLSAAQIRDRLLSFDGGRPGGANGAIILMHTGTLRQSEHAWTILGDVTDEFRSRGYTFVPVTRLIRESLESFSRPEKTP
jgi:peptidoglycan/xylan/chitin deacetylase (PgdA/CDA1 family)